MTRVLGKLSITAVVMRRRQAFSGAGYKDMSRYMPGMGGLPGGVPGIPGKK